VRKIDAIELGATLFIPATHKDLQVVVEGRKYPNLKSVLVDCEDSVSDDTIQIALKSIRQLLLNFQKGTCLVFIRPRNIKILKEILLFEGIENIDGFILPKFSLSNAREYIKTLESKYLFMPSIEGIELFNNTKLLELQEILLQHKEQIITIRFGLEDMLRQLKMRRKCEDSIFDFSVTSSVLGNFIATFKNVGFNISGGVFPCFKDSKGFKKDVLRDLKEGLFSKTIIHPNQIEITNLLYRVSKIEFEEALSISKSEQQLFPQNDKMVEVTTMSPWANDIIKRAEVYGLVD